MANQMPLTYGLLDAGCCFFFYPQARQRNIFSSSTLHTAQACLNTKGYYMQCALIFSISFIFNASLNSQTDYTTH